MIVALVDTLTEKLALEDRLKTNRAEINSIEATLRALEQVAAGAEKLVEELDLCAPYLEAQAVANIQAQASDVARDLERSCVRFATNRKEWLSIQKAGENLQRPTKDLAERWQAYARNKLAPYLDLMLLVNYLPEVATSAGELNQLVRQLEEQVKRPPHSQAQLDQFQSRLNELGRRLDSVARLPLGVRAFLARVVDGKATFADLTPEVQAWISEGDRAAAFSISFSQRRS